MRPGVAAIGQRAFRRLAWMVPLIAAVLFVVAPMTASSSTGENRLFVANYSASGSSPSITEYTKDANGNVSPLATIAGPATGLNQPSSPTLSPGGDLWAANFGGNSLTEYAAGASGNAAPIRTIQGPATGLDAPDNVTLDPRGDMWVANYSMSGPGTVTEYAPNANGNATPIRSIQGPDTGLMFPSDVVLDPAGHIFVSNMNSLTEYAPDAAGDATPIATIQGPHTELNGVAGLTLGPGGYIYAANFGYPPNYTWPGPSYGSVTVYAPGANGDATPVREIKGDYPSDDRTGLAGGPCGSPALDAEGNLYVATVTTNTVRVFAPGANGNVSPIRTIAGSATGIDSPVGVTLG